MVIINHLRPASRQNCCENGTVEHRMHFQRIKQMPWVPIEDLQGTFPRMHLFRVGLTGWPVNQLRCLVEDILSE